MIEIKYDATKEVSFHDRSVASHYGWALDERNGTLTRYGPRHPNSVTRSRAFELPTQCYIIFIDCPFDYAYRYAAEVLVLTPNEYYEYERERCFRQQHNVSSTD